MAYWEQDEQKNWHCSECREEALYKFGSWRSGIKTNYCPNCGAKMEYEKEYVPPSKKLTWEEKLLQMYNNADGRTQLKIMQFVFDLVREEGEGKEVI